MDEFLMLKTLINKKYSICLPGGELYIKDTHTLSPYYEITLTQSGSDYILDLIPVLADAPNELLSHNISLYRGDCDVPLIMDDYYAVDDNDTIFAIYIGNAVHGRGWKDKLKFIDTDNVKSELLGAHFFPELVGAFKSERGY